MARGHHLVAEAPTGSGKSLAYLAPAVASGLKVVVATSTIALQSQLVGKDLPVLAEYGSVPFTYALLKGRANYLCRAKLRAAAKPDALFEQPVVAAFSKHLEHFDKFASTSTTGDRAELAARSPIRRGRPSAARAPSARAAPTAPTATTASPSTRATAPRPSTSSSSTMRSTAPTSPRTATSCRRTISSSSTRRTPSPTTRPTRSAPTSRPRASPGSRACSPRRAST